MMERKVNISKLTQKALAIYSINKYRALDIKIYQNTDIYIHIYILKSYSIYILLFLANVHHKQPLTLLSSFQKHDLKD